MFRSSMAIATAAMLWGLSAIAAPIGTTDNFESNAAGAFPTGWLDIGAVNPAAPNPPLPSAVVVNTTDAFGNATKAVSLVDAIAESQGIYRVVPLSTIYTSKVDVRIDRHGSTNADTFTTSDWVMEVGVNRLQGHHRRGARAVGRDPCQHPDAGPAPLRGDGHRIRRS